LTAVFVSDLAIGLAKAGRTEEADAAIEKAMAHGEPAYLHFHLPEMMRIKGELLASGSRSSEAEDWFVRSRDLARKQSALAWELRTATSLAHLWVRQHRHAEAERSLQSVYDRFTEGFDTLDLKAAKRLLDELRLSCGGSERIETTSRQFGWVFEKWKGAFGWMLIADRNQPWWRGVWRSSKLMRNVVLIDPRKESQ
jgi:predicted ATPase